MTVDSIFDPKVGVIAIVLLFLTVINAIIAFRTKVIEYRLVKAKEATTTAQAKIMTNSPIKPKSIPRRVWLGFQIGITFVSLGWLAFLFIASDNRTPLSTRDAVVIVILSFNLFFAMFLSPTQAK